MEISKPKDYVIRINKNGSTIYNDHNSIEANLIAVVLNHNYNKFLTSDQLQRILDTYLNFETTVENFDQRSNSHFRGCIVCQLPRFNPNGSSITLDFVINQGDQ